ncbi:MAG: amidohydrolase family protein, partial [Bacteroidota bacterium]
ATGTMLDGVPPIIPQIALGISTPEEGRAAVRQQAEAGVNMIKVYSKLDQDVFLAILDEADQAGLKVVGHIPDSIYIEETATTGLKSSEHWFGFEKIIAKLLGEPVEFKYQGMGAEIGYLLRLDEVNPAVLQAVYERLRASGLTVTPTVVTFKNWPNVNTFDAGDIPGGEYISQDLLATWKSQWAGQSEIPDPIWQNWMEMVNGLNQAGVPLMVGTDLSVPGIVPGYSVHEEMLIWQEAGIPAAEILRSTTIVPVEFMGLQDRLGSIEEGKIASMVLVRGDPLQDIRNARQIEGVFLRGKYFNRQDLDRLLAEARDLARNPNP